MTRTLHDHPPLRRRDCLHRAVHHVAAVAPHSDAALAFGLGTGRTGAEVMEAITAGFDGTVGQIGLVIMLGAIIGTFLERSGGALGVAEAILRRTRLLDHRLCEAGGACRAARRS